MKAGSSLNGSTPHRTNGRAHEAERRCPTCGTPVTDIVYSAILLQTRQHDAEIEKAVTQRFTVQIAEAEKAKRAEIDAAVKVATQALREGQSSAIAAALEAERRRSEKAVADAVTAAKVEFATEKARLETTLADVQRKLQARTPHDRGEPAEVSLAEAIAAVLPATDIVRRVEKGQPGVDVVVEIVHGNTVVGRIAVDSKAHARWQNSFCTKLRADQLRIDAAFGILSTSVFPRGASQLHVQDGVIICDPNRVPVLVSLLRQIIVEGYTHKRGAEARNKKAEAVLKFLMSKQAHDLFDKLVGTTRSLEALDAAEVKSHQSVWTKRAGLLRDVLDIHDIVSSTISGIIEGGK